MSVTTVPQLGQATSALTVQCTVALVPVKLVQKMIVACANKLRTQEPSNINDEWGSGMDTDFSFSDATVESETDHPRNAYASPGQAAIANARLIAVSPELLD